MIMDTIQNKLRNMRYSHVTFKKASIFLILTLIGVGTYAQRGSVSGHIIDSMTKESLQYASVAIYKSSDSSLVAGVITNETGTFEITNLAPGRYYLQARFLGYMTLVTETILLHAGEQREGEDISLMPSSRMMEELTVTGNRINASNKLEKQTFTAEQFESARGGSAVDVIRNMPSVAVNGQGEITMRGSAGFLLLINGKPVLTDAQTALNQLPANMVENVELITTPSARYDPDGKAGIINITTKKGALNGSGLSINAEYGLPSITDFGNERIARRHGVDLLYTYRKDKWDISLGGNYKRNDLAGYRVGDVSIENEAENTVTSFPSEGERSFNRYNYAARAGISYKATPNDIISLGIFSGKRYQERDANIFYTNSARTLDSDSLRYEVNYYNANKQIKQGTFTLGHLDYTHIFENESSITASFLYEYDDLHGMTHNRNLSEPGGAVLQYVQNPYEKPINGYRIRFDYVVPLGNGTLESGYQYRRDLQDGIFDYLITPTEQRTPDQDRFTGTAVSVNTIHSLYSQYSGSLEKLEYIAGLRYEYAMRSVDLSIEPEVHYLDLSNLFPSANLLYTISPKFTIKAGYSRRIQRATNNQLNPIPEREHSETLEMGDPDLLPEYVSLAEIGLTKKFNNHNALFFTVYNQSSKNPVQRVNSVFADTILNRVYTNADKGNSIGFEVAADLHPAVWWDVYMGANLYRQTYSGELQILDAPPIEIDNEGWVYSVNLNTTFHITSSLSLQANVNYLSGRPTAQGEDSRYLVPNLSLKKGFLDNRLNATIQWQYIDLGLEESHRQRITTYGEHFYTTTNYIYETDFIMLHLSYKLNLNGTKAKLPTSEFGEKEF